MEILLTDTSINHPATVFIFYIPNQYPVCLESEEIIFSWLCRCCESCVIHGIYGNHDQSAHLPIVRHPTHVSVYEVNSWFTDSFLIKHAFLQHSFCNWSVLITVVNFHTFNRGFKKALHDVIMSRRAIRNMNAL